jgi:hypothetical protein
MGFPVRCAIFGLFFLLSSPPSVFSQAPPVSIPTNYHAVDNRTVYPEPALPPVGPAGSQFSDPTFGSRLLRVTDANTRPGKIGRGYAGPSAAHQNAWNVNSTRFYIRGIDGWFIPYAFDAASMTASRILPTASGDGGLVIASQVEPQFSFVSPDILFVSGQDGTDRPVIQKYDFSAGAYSDIFQLQLIANVPPSTYAAALSSSATSPEKLSVIFGGCCQDAHYKAAVFQVSPAGANPAVVDTLAGTVTVNQGAAQPTGLPAFTLHHAWIDQSGRYVMLYPANPSTLLFVVWDLETHVFTPVTTRTFGHDALGYGWQVNQDCCTSGASYDGAQWQLRSLAAPQSTSDLINPMLSPQEVYVADHTSWNNAQPDRRVPILSTTYRYYDGTFNTAPWRPWDNEVITIQTDAGSAGATVWRFAHHRSNVARDDGIDGTYFWYQPHGVISPDGRWALFTSNWEKTLGTAVGGEPSGLFRTDVFIVGLTAGTFTDDPLMSGVTTVKALHMTELRTRIDVLRASHGLAPFAWTDPSLPVRFAIIKAAHVNELRTALTEAYVAAGRGLPAFTDALTPGVTPIRAVHVQELRQAVVSLEGS